MTGADYLADASLNTMASLIHRSWAQDRLPSHEDYALARVLIDREREVIRRALAYAGPHLSREVVLEAAVQRVRESMLSDDDKGAEDDHEQDRCQCARCVDAALDRALTNEVWP